MVSHQEAGQIFHRAVNACLCPLYAIEGMHVVTVEGISHPYRQQAPTKMMHMVHLTAVQAFIMAMCITSVYCRPTARCQKHRGQCHAALRYVGNNLKLIAPKVMQYHHLASKDLSWNVHLVAQQQGTDAVLGLRWRGTTSRVSRMCRPDVKPRCLAAGIGNPRDGLHPIQERLAKAHGSQCGFCTPGFVMSMYSLLRSKKEAPTEHEIEEALAGNLW